MGLFDDIGNAFKHAGDTVANGAKGAGETIAHGAQGAGETVAHGAQDAGLSVFDWLDRENRRKQREAADYCSQKDRENEQLRRQSLAKAQQDVRIRAADFQRQAAQLQQQILQLIQRKESLLQQWQTNNVASYQKMVLSLVIALAGFARVSIALHKYSVETMRDAKLNNSVDGSMAGALSYLTTALGTTKRALQVASSRGNDLLVTTQGVHTGLRSLAEVQIPGLKSQIPILRNTLPDSGADSSALHTINSTITTLQTDEQKTRSDLFNHLDLSPGDHAAAIFTTPLREGSIYPDDWRSYADNAFRTISKYDDEINENIAKRDMLQTQLNSLDNLGQNLAPLQRDIDMLYNQASESLTTINSLNSIVSNLQVSTGQVAESFDQLADPATEPSTSRTVSILTNNAAKAVTIDYCTHGIGAFLLSRLRLVPIPAPSAGGAHRGGASTDAGTGTVQQDWTALEQALALPPKTPFPQFAATPQYGEHSHNADPISALQAELAQEIQDLDARGVWSVPHMVDIGVIKISEPMSFMTLTTLANLEANK